MADRDELLGKFWKAIGSDRTIMIAIDGAGTDDRPRPMTALVDDEAGGEESGPLWIFTATDSSLVPQAVSGTAAVATFVSKDHDLFATIHGDLVQDNDRAVIDRLWNPFVAAWYEDGKDDPKLALLRFDLGEVEIWEDGSSFVAGIKAMLGMDPKVDYQDQTTKVTLG